MINLAITQATRSCAMMKLPTKQYKSHTNNKNTIPVLILTGLLLDHSSQGKFDWTHQM